MRRVPDPTTPDPSKAPARVKRLAAVLETLAKATGRSFGHDTFGERLRTQKAIYLLKVLGIPAARRYDFNLYLRGPYSPDLAKDYFMIAPQMAGVAPEPIPERQLRVIEEFVTQGDSFLEAAATIHFIKAHSEETTKEAILAHARRIKPQLSHRYEAAYDGLQSVGLL